ncbi:MAG: hypothetical protein F4X27_14285, partial [Chloroflexi bacterium]|nr:hypothetical protein [Chloroflexota bacterium]
MHQRAVAAGLAQLGAHHPQPVVLRGQVDPRLLGRDRRRRGRGGGGGGGARAPGGGRAGVGGAAGGGGGGARGPGGGG